MTFVAEKALELADLRAPVDGEEGGLVDDRQHRSDDQRQPEAVEQIKVEFLRITANPGVLDAFERLPDIVTHHVQPENAE